MSDEPLGWDGKREGGDNALPPPPLAGEPGPPEEPQPRSILGRLWGRWGITILVLGVLGTIGVFLQGEQSSASWEVGSCVSAKDSEEIADDGDAMVAVSCDEPNEGRIIGEVPTQADCPPATDFFVTRERGGDLFCVRE